jgi:hypothetical protein
MIVGSLLTSDRLPVDVSQMRLRLHVPETVGLRPDYARE